MNEKLYRVDQFYPGDFAQILIGVYKYPILIGILPKYMSSISQERRWSRFSTQ
jgi:hypothetical protein